jgi:ADP-heptose:LPS heptosyltransferase
MALELFMDLNAEQWADDLVARELQGAPFIIIHPAASCPTRCWPTASFAGLIDRLKGSGLRIVLVGGREAVVLAAEVRAKTAQPLLDMTGQTSLSQMASLLRRARAVVSTDTGPVHVAAAVGVPTVCIFLRDQPGLNPTRWKPLGPKSVVVLPSPGKEIVVDRHSHVICGSFDAITPEQVFSAIQKII